MTASEAARRLGVSSETVRRLAASGALKGTRAWSRWEFSQEDIDEFIEASRIVPGQVRRP